MSKNTSILLGEHYLNVVAKAVESGRYSSASEVVREGLRLFEKKYVPATTSASKNSSAINTNKLKKTVK
jgi:putative addiction module CopG family antidote